MYTKTDNPYEFKYLITGISGPGLKIVYLPPQPSDDKILFKKEQKFVRPEMPTYLRDAVDEMLSRRNERTAKGQLKDPYWEHPKYQKDINEWEDREFDRTQNGIWFWNNGVATYMTKFHYWFCSAFTAYFGDPEYRETDKEICYFLEYVDEDPNCFGTAFNTIRRYGKSVLMGAWALFRTTSNFNHFCGMQGENDTKIKKFYNKFIKKPFLKLPYYHQPTYNQTGQQTESIEFDQPARQYRKGVKQRLSLESVVEFRESSEGAYDGDPLNTYLMEEPGKTLRTSIYNDDGEGRWDIVQPCLLDGLKIIGKAFLGTTVEKLNVAEKAGMAYKRLFNDSDFDQKQEDGRTKSGLYMCYLPGDCALKGYWDEWGHPKRAEARAALMLGRKKFKNNPTKLAGHIRKYSLTIREIFYVNPGSCEFNAKTLQDVVDRLTSVVVPTTSRFSIKWKNNQRLTQAYLQHDPNGWLQCSWIPPNPDQECNKVGKKLVGGIEKFHPLNDRRFGLGMDPIDHGIVVDTRVESSEDVENVGKKSKPVVLIKTKYDVNLDGYLSQDEFESRAKPGKMVNNMWVEDENGRPYEYKSNRYFAMMDTRPYDPNILYERVLLMCFYFGCSLNVESQKPGVIRYFYAHNCEEFILNKYVPVENKGGAKPFEDGTAASTTIIQEYTGFISTYVELFGHMIPFIELAEDLIRFKPRKTTEHDYTVAMGFTEMSTLIKPKHQEKKLLDLSKMLPMRDQYAA